MCVVIEGKRKGPYDPQEVRDLLVTGKLDKEALAWKSGLEDWRPLKEVWPELFEEHTIHSANAPPPTPPPPVIASAELKDT